MVLVMSTGLRRRWGPLKITGPWGGKKKMSGVSGVKAHQKGQHGASTMKEMGDASTLKMTKRTLSKFSHKKGGNGDEDKGRGGYKGRGRR